MLNSNKRENFDDKLNTTNSTHLSDDIQKEKLRTGRDPYDDSLFTDLITYENDGTLNSKLGIEKCIDECKGRCVEFGMTGTAYCFPAVY